MTNSQRDADLSTYQRQDAQWKDFRAQGVSAVIQEVNQRVRAQHPEVIVSATITSDQNQAAQVNLQDWRSWLKKGTIDVLIPRAYVNDVESLPAVLASWQPAVQEYGRVAFGVIDFVENGTSDEPKPPDRLLAEIEMAQAAGINGIMFFDLDRLSDAQLQALAAGPVESSRPYRLRATSMR